MAYPKVHKRAQYGALDVTSIRLTPEDKRRVEALKQQYGIRSTTEVVRFALKQLREQN